MPYFRLILIAETDTVYNEFATPLINRLEKHLMFSSSILEEWQVEVLDRFEAWITKFSSVRYETECILTVGHRPKSTQISVVAGQTAIIMV